MVFMSGEVKRVDVSRFVRDETAQSYFGYFRKLVAENTSDKSSVAAKTDTLIVSIIGAALCINTIKDYRWSAADELVEEMLKNILPS